MKNLVAALSLLSLLAGCAPADDSDTIIVNERLDVEPNDDESDATMLGGAGYYAISGECSEADGGDWFEGKAESEGVTEAAFRVRSAGDALRVVIRDSESKDLADSGEITLGDASSFTGVVPSPQTIYLEVICPGNTPTAYIGTLLVP